LLLLLRLFDLKIVEKKTLNNKENENIVAVRVI
jgi:hypothetical protein